MPAAECRDAPPAQPECDRPLEALDRISQLGRVLREAVHGLVSPPTASGHDLRSAEVEHADEERNRRYADTSEENVARIVGDMPEDLRREVAQLEAEAALVADQGLQLADTYHRLVSESERLIEPEPRDCGTAVTSLWPCGSASALRTSGHARRGG